MSGRPGGRRGAAAFRTAAILALTALVGACAPRASAAVGAAASLTVFAAASLREPLRDIAATYEAMAGVSLTLVTDSSSALRTQIEQGAQADVFLAADTVNPEALASAGLTDGPAVEFAGNRLAVIVPADNPAGLASPADLARPGVAIVAAGDRVPITRYAGELLRRLAALPGYPPDLPAAYDSNVVTREDNVRSVVTRIELGEGDAAIVYATDAATAEDVTTLAIPEAAIVTATYAGAVLASAVDRGAARAFLDWLAGPDGRAILVAHGFVALP
jgi:molybdate transport system substrate-binding protein